MKVFLRHRLWLVALLVISIFLFISAVPSAETLAPHKFTPIDNSIGFLSCLGAENKSKPTVFYPIRLQFQSEGMSSAEVYLEKLADMQNPTRIRQGVISFIIGTPLAIYGIYDLTNTKKREEGIILTASGVSLDALAIHLLHGKSHAQKSFEKAMQTKDEAEDHQIALETLRFYARNYRAFRIGAGLLFTASGIVLLGLPAEESWAQTKEENETMKAMSVGLCFSAAVFFLVWKTPPEKLYNEYRKETQDIQSLTPSLGFDGKGHVLLSLSYNF
jgi:hypothetical protein